MHRHPLQRGERVEGIRGANLAEERAQSHAAFVQLHRRRQGVGVPGASAAPTTAVSGRGLQVIRLAQLLALLGHGQYRGSRRVPADRPGSGR